MATTATRPSTAALRLHDRGEVWTANSPLTTVLYQLRIPYGASEETRAGAREEEREIEVKGTILRYGLNWEALSEPRSEALWLRLGDGRRMKFRVTASAGAAALHIAGVHEDQFEVEPVGVPEIDEQHLRLVQVLNGLGASPRHWLLLRGSFITPAQALVDAMSGVYAEIERHFATEDRLMDVASYPGSEQHQEAHNLLLGLLRELQGNVERGETPLDGWLLWRLRNWWRAHLEDGDLRLAGFLIPGRGADDSEAPSR